MASENRSSPYVVHVITALILGWAWAPISSAQEVADEGEGSGIVAWHGCWQPEEAGEDTVLYIIEGASHTLCINSGKGANSLRLQAISDGRVVAEEELITNGERHSFEQDGCEGWKRAMLSDDRQRIYLQSETTCERGEKSHLSGAMQVLDRSRWIDINVMRVGDQREVIVRRYRALEIDPLILQSAIPTAEQTARIVASARLNADDVVEALEVLDPSIVEALLVETGSSFPMNSKLLLRLDDAGVPSEIIDLMVALSYPEHFDVEGERFAAPAVGYDSYWDPWRFGYGYDHHYWYWYHDDWDDHDSPGSGRSTKGRAISGRGYTRVRAVDPPPRGPSSTTGAGTGSNAGGTGSQGSSSTSAGSVLGGSTGSAGSSGYSRSGSSKGKAVRR
jgi:hypothetical protein